MLAAVSNRTQFTLASVLVALGGQVAGGRFDRHRWRCLGQAWFWLGVILLVPGALWLARLTFPAGPSTQPTSMAGSTASPTPAALQTDPFQISKAVLNDSQLVKGPWRIVTPQRTLPLTSQDARRLDALFGRDNAIVPEDDNTIHVVENVGVELRGRGGPVPLDYRVYGALKSPWGSYHCAETFTYSPHTREWSATINVGPGPWTFYVLLATTNEARDALDVWMRETREAKARSRAPREAKEHEILGREGVLTNRTFHVVADSFGPPLHNRYLTLTTAGQGSTSLTASPGPQ